MAIADVTAIVERKLTGSRFTPEQIEDAVKEAEYQIRNYCGRWQYEIDDQAVPVLEELPRQLDYVWVNMAIAYVQLNYNASVISAPIDPSTANGSVKQIKEGDTTIEFTGTSTTDSGITASNQIVDSYAAELNPYRRLYAGVRGGQHEYGY